MSKIIYRLSWDATGRVRPPRLLPARTLIVGERFLSGLSGAPGQALPELARPWIAQLADQARARLAALHGFRSPEPSRRMVEPSPEALAIVGAEILADSVRLDRLIEAMLRSVDNITLGHAEAPEETPSVEVARELRAALFYDGRRFVQLPLDEQWLETELRLANLTPDLLEESNLLGVKTRLVHLGVLNQHLGRLLGLTEPAPSTPTPSPDLASLNADALNALIALAVAIFAALPGEDAEADPRAALLAPLLDELG